MSKDTFQKNIENLLAQKISQSHVVSEHTLFVCRNDGLILFFHSHNELINKDSIGALVGGLWQAGKTVVNIFDKEENPLSFRLSFDTSSCGLHLLPFEAHGEEYFMGLYFSELINPAMVKNKLKQLTSELVEALGQVAEAPRTNIGTDESSLFKNITDDEINTLFSFAEN